MKRFLNLLLLVVMLLTACGGSEASSPVEAEQDVTLLPVVQSTQREWSLYAVMQVGDYPIDVPNCSLRCPQMIVSNIQWGNYAYGCVVEISEYNESIGPSERFFNDYVHLVHYDAAYHQLKFVCMPYSNVDRVEVYYHADE